MKKSTTKTKTKTRPAPYRDPPLKYSFVSLGSAVIAFLCMLSIIPLALVFGLLAVGTGIAGIVKGENKITSTIGIIIGVLGAAAGSLAVLLVLAMPGQPSIAEDAGESSLQKLSSKEEVDAAAAAISAYKQANNSTLPAVEDFYSDEFRIKYGIDTRANLSYVIDSNCTPDIRYGVKEGGIGEFYITGYVTQEKTYCVDG